MHPSIRPRVVQSGDSHSDHLNTRNAKSIRSGWDKAFAAIAQHGYDTLIDSDCLTEWDRTEWDW